MDLGGILHIITVMMGKFSNALKKSIENSWKSWKLKMQGKSFRFIYVKSNEV
jgi:hypothetical protein